MNSPLLRILLFVGSIVLYACQTPDAKSDGSIDSIATVPEDSVPYYAQRIIDAYPQFALKYEENRIIFPSGDTILYDDYQEKTFVERLDYCDIEDMFADIYDTARTLPAYLCDCGRGRNEALFKSMYGHSEQEVRQHLVDVLWFGQRVKFTEVNDAAKHLQKVADELAQMPQYTKYLTNASTFYWRKVRGANRQSAHSYGIAIDINTKFANYWLWSNPKASEYDSIQYINQIPQEIVRVFEKHGFIWGGRWYHFDTMHFEYRPEFYSGE